MNDDWQSRLAALRQSMGDTPAEEEKKPDATPAPTPQKGRIDIVLERKGRAGKTATIAVGFDLSDDELADLASQIKRALGTGGSSRGGEILIQGDRRNDVLCWLTSRGFKARII